MKALTIGFVLSLLNQFTGVFIFLIYVGTILSKTGSILDANIAAILLGVCQVAGPLVSTYIADKMARKTLMIISLIGSVIGQLTLAIFSYLQDRNYNLTTFQWVPVTSLSFVVFIGSLGIVSMSPLCTLEILPRKVNSMAILQNTFRSMLLILIFPDSYTRHDIHDDFVECIFIFDKQTLSHLVRNYWMFGHHGGHKHYWDSFCDFCDGRDKR